MTAPVCDPLRILRRETPAGSPAPETESRLAIRRSEATDPRSRAPGEARERTKLQFTKHRSKSGPGEPSRPYYCVRISKIERREL